MSSFKRYLPAASCLAAVTLACTASWAQDAAPTCKSVTQLQRRIVERADQGIDSLRSFVHMTEFVHGVGMEDVRQSLDGWRAAVECQQQAARAAATVEVAAKAGESPR